MARLNRSRFPRTGARRRVSWAISPSGQVGPISGNSNNAFPTSAVASLDDLTVVRTRGRLLLQLITADAVGSGFEWAFGMCVVTQNAAGVGVTALPDPIGDIAWDGWFVYEQGWLVASDATPIVDRFVGEQQLIEIDSKAMRKTHLTDNIVAMLGVQEVGTATVRAAFTGRMLSKLA